VALSQPAETLRALEPVLGNQPGWVLVTLAAIAAVAVILRGGTLARIVESFHARANYRDTVRLMQGQLLERFSERSDVTVVDASSEEGKRLLAADEGQREPVNERGSS
jgi:hypothetical protein